MRTANIHRINWKAGVLFILTAIFVVVFDQVSKYLVRDSMTIGQSIPQEGFIQLTYVYNTGGAFSLFSDQTRFLIIAASIGVIAIIFCYWLLREKNVVIRIGLGLLLGSALGNLIDRIFLNGRVTDFISIGYWPIFNIADLAGVIGVGLIMIYIIFLASEKKDSSRQ